MQPKQKQLIKQKLQILSWRRSRNNGPNRTKNRRRCSLGLQLSRISKFSVSILHHKSIKKRSCACMHGERERRARATIARPGRTGYLIQWPRSAPLSGISKNKPDAEKLSFQDWAKRFITFFNVGKMLLYFTRPVTWLGLCTRALDYHAQARRY